MEPKTMEPKGTERRGTETATRVADVLLLFTDGPDSLGVSAIARSLGLSKTVVHRTLSSLLERGFLVSDPHTREYSLGPSLASLGARALRESSLRTAALPVMRRLHGVTGETVTISARVPGGRAYIEQIESTREIKMTVELGRRFPLHAGSSSMCILAFLPEAERRDYLTDHPLEALTTKTVTDARELQARLENVRARGVAESDGERQQGAGSVAAPIFGFDGQVVGALSVCGPAYRMHGEARAALIPHVRAAADEVSRGLGWRGGPPHEMTQDAS
ncbi:MAG TPA: IclR family transcriptional regulator [Intrasporangium sp.]|uniref:IclR family transcriptional regulator n=1 Tax=Intrasporangium sp. TaxID=1925024 RepID=UPI002D7A3DFB|nr:IclR family transcriptional regulator [Intrasporangium sp.]HET7400094.1 IclR family transcriptional regulator [Intrasporangium sp.]